METIFIVLSLAHVTQVILSQQYFRVKPHDTSVVAGRTAELHCHVGNQAGLVQWSKDGFLLGYDPEIPGYERYEMRVDHSKSAYTLLVHEARLDDEAEFQCQVGPGKNEKPIRSVARLTVLVPPKNLSINDLPNGSEIEVREAEKVVLQCQALSSKPATIIKWYRKNIELMPDASKTSVRRQGEKLYSTISSITLYPKGDTSGSSFTCEALHPALERSLRTTVAIVLLYPPSHPEINGYTEGDLLYAGDKLILRCSSNGGKPAAIIVWYRNGEIIEGSFTTIGRDSSNIISITVHSSDNNAVYACAASNPLTPRPLIGTVKISVVFPPKYLSIDGPSEVSRGESVTVHCRSDISNPPVELSWMVDGIAVQTQDTTLHPAENGCYSTSNLTAFITKQDKNVKIFACTAYISPRHGKVFETFNVTILYPPEVPTISGYEEKAELKEGDHQIFKCAGLAGNPPSELRWFRGETEVSSASSVASGRISSIISFGIEASDNEIVVRCEVNNTSTIVNLSAQVKLSVFFPPQNVTLSVDPLQPREGDQVRLECWSGSSNPLASIQWWRNGVIINNPLQSQIVKADFGGSSTGSWITIQVTSSDHESHFICAAKNDAFQSSPQQKVTLKVFHRPIIKKTLLQRRLAVSEGEFAKITCIAEGYPDVVFTWSSNASNHIDAIKHNTKQNQNQWSSTLSVENIAEEDYGVYTCFAGNNFGHDITTFNIIKKSLPVMDSTISDPVFRLNTSVDFLPTWLLVTIIIGGLIVILVCIIYIRRKRYAHQGGNPDVSREKMNPEDPFYLSGTSVDDVDRFQKPHRIHQVSRKSSEDASVCGGIQWSLTCTPNQHEQCPDILMRDNCHCHSEGKWLSDDRRPPPLTTFQSQIIIGQISGHEEASLHCQMHKF